MTYNHEETKVRDPSAAKEVERLRAEVERIRDDCMYFETALRLAEKQLQEIRARNGGF